MSLLTYSSHKCNRDSNKSLFPLRTTRKQGPFSESIAKLFLVFNAFWSQLLSCVLVDILMNQFAETMNLKQPQDCLDNILISFLFLSRFRHGGQTSFRTEVQGQRSSLLTWQLRRKVNVKFVNKSKRFYKWPYQLLPGSCWRGPAITRWMWWTVWWPGGVTRWWAPPSREHCPTSTTRTTSEITERKILDNTCSIVDIQGGVYLSPGQGVSAEAS